MPKRTFKQPFRCPSNQKKHSINRQGAALLFALFVMTIASTLVVAMVDTHTMRYAALRNTRDWDMSRYLAETGLHHVFAELEQNIDWRGSLPTTEFPIGSGHQYSATATDGADGTVIVVAVGTVGTFTRTLQATVKQGG